MHAKPLLQLQERERSGRGPSVYNGARLTSPSRSTNEMCATEWNKAASRPPPPHRPAPRREGRSTRCSCAAPVWVLVCCLHQAVCLPLYLCRVIFLPVLLTVTLCIQQAGFARCVGLGVCLCLILRLGLTKPVR